MKNVPAPWTIYPRPTHPVHYRSLSILLKEHKSTDTQLLLESRTLDQNSHYRNTWKRQSVTLHIQDQTSDGKTCKASKKVDSVFVKEELRFCWEDKLPVVVAVEHPTQCFIKGGCPLKARSCRWPWFFAYSWGPKKKTIPRRKAGEWLWHVQSFDEKNKSLYSIVVYEKVNKKRKKKKR